MRAATRRSIRSEGPFHSQQQTPSAVLTGDFNCRTTDPAYARVIAPFDERVAAFEDAWTVLHPGVAHAPTAACTTGSSGRSRRLRFVFARRDLRPGCGISVDATSRASDHQPVMLESD